jgi:hypothetical protein
MLGEDGVMKKLIVWILPFMVYLQFCAKRPEEPTHRIEFIEGLKVVKNLRTESEKTFKDKEFIDDLTIGMEEGEENYMFSNPVDVDSDSKGNIYVLDSQECLIKKYDSKGVFIRNFGREGQGPGEFTSPSSMMITPQDEIYVGDYMSRKIEVFGSQGEYQETMKVEFIYDFSLTGKKDLIVGYQFYDQEGMGSYKVGKYDLQKNKIIDFYGQKTYWPARISDNEFAYDFPYFVRWSINSDDKIYIASGVAYEISVFTPEGNLLFKFTKDSDAFPVAGEEFKRISDRLTPTRGPNPFMAKAVYPFFKFIACDEKDRVWVEHYQPRWHKRANKETVYDVFSADGIFLFSTKIPGHIYPQPAFKNAWLYALRKDDSGISRAVRLRMIE